MKAFLKLCPVLVLAGMLLSGVDINMFKRLGVDLTCEPKYEA